MLAALGAPIEVDGCVARVRAGALESFELDVPGDPSSAAFFVVAASITPGSEIVIEDVSLNPTRLGFVDVLVRMGAAIESVPKGERCGEPVGDLVVRAAPLTATVIEGDEIPNVQDEVPALAVAAAFADGVTDIRDAAELAGQGEQPDRDDSPGAVATRHRRRAARRRARDPRRRAAGRAAQEPRRPSHRDGGGDRRERHRRRVDGARLASGGVVVPRVRRRPRRRSTGSDERRPTAHDGVRVAIDGSSGSGKSTVARAVADALELPVLDTGAMYRAVTLAVLERKLAPDDERGRVRHRARQRRSRSRKASRASTGAT